MQRNQFNEVAIQGLQDSAQKKLARFRQLLQDDVERYKASGIYRRRLTAYQTKVAAHDQVQKHQRLVDVEQLELIIASAKTTTELNTNVSEYLNRKTNFTGFGHFSRLRTRLNSTLRGYLKANNLADIDAHLQLMTNVDVEDDSMLDTEASATTNDTNAPAFVEKGKEEANALSVDTTQLQAELKRTKLELRNAKSQNIALRDQVQLGQQHIAARDELNSKLKDELQEVQAQHTAFVQQYGEYAKKSINLITLLGSMIDTLRDMLKLSTRTGIKGGIKSNKYRGEIKSQLKEKKGEHFDLLINRTISGKNQINATQEVIRQGEWMSQLAGKASEKAGYITTLVEHDPNEGLRAIEAVSFAAQAATAHDSDESVDDDNGPPPPPPRDDKDLWDGTTSTPAGSMTEAEAAVAPPPPKLPAFTAPSATPATMFAATSDAPQPPMQSANANPLQSALAAKLGQLKHVQPPQPKSGDGSDKPHNDLHAGLLARFNSLNPHLKKSGKLTDSVPTSDSDSDDEQWNELPAALRSGH